MFEATKWIRCIWCCDNGHLSNLQVTVRFWFEIHTLNQCVFSEITPLDTIEIIDTDDDGKLLASPYLDNENKESGDKCLWIGEEEADRLWTDICDVTEEWQIWNFEPVKKNSEKFYLVNAYNGKCVRPTSHRSGSMVQSIDCSSDNDLIWKWFEGQ